jgi:uncharacterized protein (TIGR00290 family)
MSTAPVRPRAAISWSGGKDSCTALHRARSAYDVVTSLTVFDEQGARSRSHGLRPELLTAQARRLGLRHVTARCAWATYEAAFAAALAGLRREGITHVIFGDIAFDDHRAWTERLCRDAGLVAVEPIFGESTSVIVREFIASGSEAMIVTARAAHLDASYLGRLLTLELVEELQRLGVDPCGERGEYHTLVTRSPLFSHPLQVRAGRSVLRSDCWSLDLEIEPDDTARGGNRAPRR